MNKKTFLILFFATLVVVLVIAGAIAVIAIYAATLSIALNRTDAAREFSSTSASLGL